MKKLLSLVCSLLFFACSSTSEMNKEEPAHVVKTESGLNFYFKTNSQIKKLKINKHLSERVDRWVEVFTGDFKPQFEQYLNNGQPYKKMVQEILEEHGLPAELYYLPVIESGYVLKARSHMGAVGPWQFIRSTGRNYGLVANSYLDERQNIFKATQAAAAHLRDLYNIFGSWELALASYNAGINRITGLIIKGSNREFSKMVELGILPSETEDYIPKFMAAVIIGKQPEKYGFKIDPVNDFLSEHRIVPVPGGVSLRKVAKAVGISYRELASLNLEYRRGYIPRYEREAEIVIPTEFEAAFKTKTALINKLAKASKRKVAANNGAHYRVRRGDSLSRIASKHRMGVATLARMNGISRRDPIYPGQLLKVKGDFSGIYTVRRGDSLYIIGSRYGLSTRQLREINGLSSSRIYPGQKLRVSAQDGNFYVVQKGDTLWDIARENNISLRRIKRMNALKNGRIYAGQKLKI